MTGTVAISADVPKRQGLLAGTVRTMGTIVLGAALCLTPPTALIALGWLTRKTAHDIRGNQGAPSNERPKFVRGDPTSDRRISRWFGGLVQNLSAGVKAWFGVIAFTLPFSLAWLTGWFAGWENSFSKGYEQAGVWPTVSLLAVFLSLPILSLLPMAVAHQAQHASFASMFALKEILNRVRAAGWRYLMLTILITLGGVGVLGARALPVFGEHMLAENVQGDVKALKAFGAVFKIVMTVGLFAGILLVRKMMASTYAHAEARMSAGEMAGKFKSLFILTATGALWLSAVFIIYVGQFLNYNWWAWFNQPVLMLPWLMTG